MGEDGCLEGKWGRLGSGGHLRNEGAAGSQKIGDCGEDSSLFRPPASLVSLVLCKKVKMGQADDGASADAIQYATESLTSKCTSRLASRRS